MSENENRYMIMTNTSNIVLASVELRVHLGHVVNALNPVRHEKQQTGASFRVY